MSILLSFRKEFINFLNEHNINIQIYERTDESGNKKGYWDFLRINQKKDYGRMHYQINNCTNTIWTKYISWGCDNQFDSISYILPIIDLYFLFIYDYDDYNISIEHHETMNECFLCNLESNKCLLCEYKQSSIKFYRDKGKECKLNLILSDTFSSYYIRNYMKMNDYIIDTRESFDHGHLYIRHIKQPIKGHIDYTKNIIVINIDKQISNEMLEILILHLLYLLYNHNDHDHEIVIRFQENMHHFYNFLNTGLDILEYNQELKIKHTILNPYLQQKWNMLLSSINFIKHKNDTND